MRVLATADLHYNHPRSQRLAADLIDQMSRAGGDVLLVVGDTATADGNALEECLQRFRFAGPRLFVAGNHELWTAGPDSHRLFTDELPARVASAGWHWLEGAPLLLGPTAFVGSIGWYDYTFAPAELAIPRRFYEHKIAPGAAAHLSQFRHLVEAQDDTDPSMRDIYSRWNDARFVKLHRTDEQFLAERLAGLAASLDSVRAARQVIAAVHHLPFRQMLPPPRNAQWDFAKAFLGSERLGQLLLDHANVTHAICGHTHLADRRQIGHIDAINVGSGYRWKTYVQLDLPD